MESEKITVGQEEALIKNALSEADKFVKQAGFEGKKAIHINLLTEEVLGMVRAMVGDFSARFWLESDKDDCRINVDAVAEVDSAKKRELLSVSKSGKNVANRGLMAKIGEFFENCLNDYEEMVQYSGDSAANYGYIYSAGVPAHTMMTPGFTVWSLSQYRTSVSEDKNTNEDAEEAWDELEKSIIANLADDVIVGVRDNHVTLTIVKSLK